jgi:DNA-3-methyladenine glycosylase II
MNIQKELKELQKIEPKIFDFCRDLEIDLFEEIILEKQKTGIYESLIRAIAHQMVHGNAAKACLKRLSELENKKLKIPNAKFISKLKISNLRKCGFSENKSRAISEIAKAKVEKKLPTDKKLENMSNEEIIKTLLPLRGVGKWTIEMFLIFNLHRKNIFPVDDFGVREGFRIYIKEEKQRKAQEFTEDIKYWTGYETLISMIFWKIADKHKKIKQIK